MPRSRKTAAGTPAQPVQAMTGQQYGKAREQEALQQAMPVPAVPTTLAPRAQQQPASEVPVAPQPRPRMAPEEAMAFLSGMGGILTAPDDNPALPVTDGLSTGPGRGPEALSGQSALGDTLRRLAFQTNDPVFLRLASRIEF